MRSGPQCSSNPSPGQSNGAARSVADPPRDLPEYHVHETEYGTLYQTQLWDYDTPIKESMEAFHEVVRTAHARYMVAIENALHDAEKHGRISFVTMQDPVDLIYR